MTDTKTTLFAKLASILGTIKNVPKTGWNDFHKYNYIREEDLVDAIRPLLAAQGVSILFECEEILHVEPVQTSRGKTERIVAVRCAITIGDKDGNEHKVSMIGEGQDSGDKAVYKAMTGAFKYWLYKTFMVSTGDDPENPPGDPPPPGSTSERRRSQGTGAKLLISEAQGNRLWAIARSVGWDNHKLKAFVESHWGYTISKDIQRRHYEAIVACVEEERAPTEEEKK